LYGAIVVNHLFGVDSLEHILEEGVHCAGFRIVAIVGLFTAINLHFITLHVLSGFSLLSRKALSYR
jgi:hypothetical protein